MARHPDAAISVCCAFYLGVTQVTSAPTQAQIEAEFFQDTPYSEPNDGWSDIEAIRQLGEQKTQTMSDLLAENMKLRGLLERAVNAANEAGCGWMPAITDAALALKD
jgi:hypothetical protein